MIGKVSTGVAGALDRIVSGATIAVSGFGDSGMPRTLLAGLRERGTSDLKIIANNP